MSDDLVIRATDDGRPVLRSRSGAYKSGAVATGRYTHPGFAHDMALHWLAIEREIRQDDKDDGIVERSSTTAGRPLKVDES